MVIFEESFCKFYSKKSNKRAIAPATAHNPNRNLTGSKNLFRLCLWDDLKSGNLTTPDSFIFSNSYLSSFLFTVKKEENNHIANTSKTNLPRKSKTVIMAKYIGGLWIIFDNSNSDLIVSADPTSDAFVGRFSIGITTVMTR